jgi:hypothetical protein
MFTCAHGDEPYLKERRYGQMATQAAVKAVCMTNWTASLWHRSEQAGQAISNSPGHDLNRQNRPFGSLSWIVSLEMPLARDGLLEFSGRIFYLFVNNVVTHFYELIFTNIFLGHGISRLEFPRKNP